MIFKHFFFTDPKRNIVENLETTKSVKKIKIANNLAPRDSHHLHLSAFFPGVFIYKYVHILYITFLLTWHYLWTFSQLRKSL